MDLEAAVEQALDAFLLQNEQHEMPIMEHDAPKREEMLVISESPE